MNSPTTTSKPRYRQIADELSAQILRGKFALGSLLPTEIEICTTYQASRHTTREALRILTDDGLVERRQGHGTRVVSTEPHAFKRSISSITDLLQYGANTHLQVISSTKIKADARIAELLDCPVGTRCIHVHCLRSERHVKMPFCVTDIYRLVTDDALTKRLSNPKEAVFAIVDTLSINHIGRVEQRISANRLNAQSAQVLGAKTKDPCLMIVRRHFDHDDALIMAAINQHRADDFVYVMELKRSS